MVKLLALGVTLVIASVQATVPAPIVPASPDPSVQIDYLEQLGGHFSGRIAVSTASPLRGHLVLTLLDARGARMGIVCGPIVDVPPGTRILPFDAYGPAIVFDTDQVSIASC